MILDLEHRSATQPIGEMLNGIADSVSILDQDWRISYLNRSAEETLRRMKPELNGVVGKNLWEMVPELRGSNLEHEYRLAITENRPRTFELFFAPLDKWLEIRCFPTASGLMVYSRDISSQRYREQLSALRNEVSIALSKKGDLQAILQECAGLLVNHLNAAFARIWLLNPQTNVLELKASAGLYTHLDGPHGKVPVGQFKIGRIAQSKLPHLSNDVPNDPHVSDQAWARREGMVAFAGYPLLVEGRVVGVVALFARQKLANEILEDLMPLSAAIAQFLDRRSNEKAVIDQANTLKLLNQIGSTIAAELELERLLQVVTDEATKIVRAQFGAFFYNALTEKGEALMLYTLSGAPKEAFSRFGMPRATDLFGPTFRGEGIIRLEDVRKDSRYGRMSPHHGMPKGHLPVVSYLAAPVISRSGEVLGGLFFGHPEPGRFGPDAEDFLKGIAAQAAIAIDNARLFGAAQREIAERKKAEEKLALAQADLRRYAGTLEERVAERTAKLQETVNSLERFTYSIAHDLRAPLRGMAGLSYALLKDYSSKLDQVAVDYGKRIIDSAKRMDALIQDLLGYARLTQVEIPLAMLSLDDQVDNALRELRADIEKSGAEVVVARPLGEVFTNEAVLEQVLMNLISNALKFVPEGVKPRVEIRAEQSGERTRVFIKDNGLGIAPEHHERIFRVFERLQENNRYPGTGIGLAVVQKGVERLGGKVGLHSEEGQGATFWIDLPNTGGGRNHEHEIEPAASDLARGG